MGGLLVTLLIISPSFVWGWMAWVAGRDQDGGW